MVRVGGAAPLAGHPEMDGVIETTPSAAQPGAGPASGLDSSRPDQGKTRDLGMSGPLAAVPGRLRRWSGIFAAFFTAQSLTQLAGLVAGLLLVRHMPVEQFALYTLAMSILAFFAITTDLGSTGSLVYFFRQADGKPEEFDQFRAAVASLRRAAFGIGALFVLGLLPLLGRAKGFGLGPGAAVAAMVLVAVWFQIGASLDILALRLRDRYGPTYRAELTGGLVRLGGVGIMILLAWLHAWVGLLVAALAAASVAWIARAADAADSTPSMSSPSELAPYRRRVLRYLLPTLPGAMYFAFQGPLVVWLAASFGETRNIAEVGALGRLGLIVGMFSMLSGVVFLPHLARISDERHYLVRFAQFGALLGGLSVALVAWSWIAPSTLLWLIGPAYAGLDQELLLAVVSASLGVLGGYLVGINNARSWNRWQPVAVSALILAQVIMVLLLPLGTTLGVLWFGVGSAAVGLGLQLTISALGFLAPRLVAW